MLEHLTECEIENIMNLTSDNGVLWYLKQEIIRQWASNPMFTGPALVAGLSAAGLWTWQMLRTYPARAWARIKRWLSFRVTIEQNDELFEIVEKYLQVHHQKKFRNVRASYNELEMREGNTKKDVEIWNPKTESWEKKKPSKKDPIKYDQFTDSGFVWNYWPIWATKVREKLEGARGASESHKEYYSFFTLLNRKSVKGLMEKAVNYHLENQTKDDRIKVKTFQRGYWRTKRTKDVRDFDKVFLEQNQKEELLSDIENFISDETRKWYKDRGIPYKRGYLLHGDPGNGKSTIIQTLAKKIKRNIYYLNLSSMANDEMLLEAFDSLSENSILVIEDIDAVFKQRENIVKGSTQGINFSTFLNCVDGALSVEGIITFITTNKYSYLDSALLRNGRMDMKMEIKNPSEEMVVKYVNRFFEDDEPFTTSTGIPYAQLQGICFSSDSKVEAVKQIKKVCKK